MVNKILIRTSDRKILHKDRRTLGMNGENLQEVLLFCLDEKIEGNGIVEVELPNGEKGMIEVSRTEEGYELPVKSSLLTQTGFVKFQLRILHDDVEIFKSEIIALEVKDSINATETIPEQYPTWIDNLTTLKQELEKAESERVSNEEKRQSAEETRQENFTKMQETVSNAVSNIKDLTDKYNSNAEKETKKFNDNAVEQTKTFNDNSDSKLVEYNKKHTDKIKEYDDNSKAKLDAYNKNDTDKINAYNDNTVLKEKAYNDNAADKVKEYNTNVEQKETELEKLAEKKINEYNQVSAELTAKVEQVQAENEALKTENKLIKEQIPSATASGNNINIKDSGSLDFDWKIRGGHKQERREGYNIINTKLLTQINTKGIDRIINDDGSLTIKGTATAESNIQVLASEEEKLEEGNYTFVCYGLAADYYVNIYYVGNVYGENIRSFSTDGTKNIGMILTIPEGKTVNFKIYPFLIKGTYTKETIPTYEQYGVSPSPDYPSKVETVGSNVNILENKAISQTLNGVDFLVKEDKSIIVNGTSTDRINFVLSSNNKLKAGTYTLSGCPDGGSTASYHLDVALIGTKTYLIDNGSSNTAKLDNDLDNLTYRILIEKGVSLNSVVFKPKLEKCTVETPYSLYNQGSAEVKVINKNWLTNFENINNTNSGITMVGNKDNVKVTGTATRDWVVSNYAELENLQAGNYIFSYSSEQGLRYKIWIYNSEKSAIIYNLDLNQKISVPQNYKKLSFKIILEKLTSGQIVNDTAYFQIEKGSTSTDIVEHQSQTAIMPIQQEMLTGDYIEGVEHHEWDRLALMGDNVSGRWTVDGGNEYRFVIAVDNMLPASSITEKTNIICNTLKTVSALDTYNKIEGIAGDKNSNILIYIEECKDMTVEEFKAYLNQKYNSGTPVTIYYKLATPLNLELTEEQKAVREQKLYTYKNITNIDVSDELASIDVEYKKDQDTINKNYENRLAALEAATIS